MAAYQFSELCKARCFSMACFCVRTEFSDEELREVALAAVDLFMTKYGASGSADVDSTRQCNLTDVSLV